MVRDHTGTPARVCAVTIAVRIFFAAAMEVVLQRFSEDDTILENLVFLDEGSGGGPYETLLDRVRRAVWGMLYADDAEIVSRSPAGLATMMTVIVEVFCAFGLTVSEKKTETLLIRAPEKAQQPGETPTPPLPALEIATAGQKYNQVHQPISPFEIVEAPVRHLFEAQLL